MVVGVGGLEHLGLQYARIFGTRTVAVDVHDDELQLAKDLGATTSSTPAVTKSPSSRPSAASTSLW